MRNTDKKYRELSAEIEKVKFHNRSLLTLLGLLNEKKMVNTTIYEAVVLFDLSKSNLRGLKTLILDYNGNNFALEQKALLINPVLTKDNLVFIIKSFVNADMFIKQGNEILNNYDTNK
ncbi:hypothetical protein ACXYMX_16740 [Sporosarcina sp. CAU 1771]